MRADSSAKGARRFAALLMAVSLSLTPLAALATVGPASTYPQDTTLLMSGPSITLLITAGSADDNLTVTPTTFTVTVPTGSTFTARYPGPNPGKFPNDGALAECHIVAGNNDFVVTGPKIVTVTPNPTHCTSGGGGGAPPTPPSIDLFQPNGGTFTAGDTATVIWSIGGDGIASARLSLSTDGGATYNLIATGLPGNSYPWTVPNVGTTQALIRVQGLDASGAVVASDASSAAFTILGSTTPPPPPETPPAIHFDPGAATEDGGPTISDDKDLPSDQQGTVDCPAHWLIKLPDDGNVETQMDSTVYYCGRDGRRWVFPNPGTYFTWYHDFSGVQIVDAARMARIPLGKDVTYRPGIRMIKLPIDPKVYAISKDGTLHLVPDEATVRALYGDAWSKHIDDINPAFFSDYEVGADVEQGG